MEESPDFGALNRRGVLRALGVAVTSLAALGSVTGTTTGINDGSPDKEARRARRRSAAKRRIDAAMENTMAREFVSHPINGDELWYPSKLASYSKGLPHDALGEVDLEAYQALTKAIEGDGEFSAIPLGGTRMLENPEATYSFNMTGYDPNDVYIEPPPAFASAETAAEMVELYWHARLRDVPFTDYDTHPLVEAATDELGDLDDFLGPTKDGTITAQTLFRGNLEGALVGPHISQFLYQDIQRGMIRQNQKFPVATPGRDFMTAYQPWLEIQNGRPPTASEGYSDERYIITGRDLATLVHRDTPHQLFLAAALILLDAGVPLDEGNPYTDSHVQSSFIDYGIQDVIGAVTSIVLDVQHANWYHKWQVHRRLRPEAFGGRLHNHLIGKKDYPIDGQLLDAAGVGRTRDKFGTYLLPQAYPEGAPLHPAFPAGHGGIAGACVTVLKAYFEEEARLPVAVRPTADGTALEPIRESLTVGGELNKLATNHTLGRNWAGIHYRSDGADGLRMGERLAISCLRDRLQSKAAVGSFTLTTFDGEKIEIQS